MKYTMMFAIFVLAPITGELIALRIREHYFQKENEKRVSDLLDMRREVIHMRNFWKKDMNDDQYAIGRADSCDLIIMEIDKQISKGGSKC